jgi:hypothetical protein
VAEVPVDGRIAPRQKPDNLILGAAAVPVTLVRNLEVRVLLLLNIQHLLA